MYLMANCEVEPYLYHFYLQKKLYTTKENNWGEGIANHMTERIKPPTNRVDKIPTDRRDKIPSDKENKILIDKMK